MSLSLYYAAVLSAIGSVLWMPDEDTRGWPVALVMLWVVAVFAVFVWNAPRPKDWPRLCDCCGEVHR